MAEPPVTFAALLRKLRAEARLTQEQLAESARLIPRSVSDLEWGIATTPQGHDPAAGRRAASGRPCPGEVRGGRTRPCRPRRYRRRVGGAVPATRKLPRDIASFTGRQRELQELVKVAAGVGGVVGIHAIGRMAGVGKTAFTVHAAHRLADRFHGGQKFLPLYGHTPGQQPVDPTATARLLPRLLKGRKSGPVFVTEYKARAAPGVRPRPVGARAAGLPTGRSHLQGSLGWCDAAPAPPTARCPTTLRTATARPC